MVVEAWLQRAAASAPTTVALETPAGSCSYAELLARAHAGADELAACGVARGQRVAIALPAGLDFAYALHACLLLGAVAVPVDLRLAERERRAICAGAAVVLEQPLSSAAGEPAVAASGGHDLDAVAAVIHTSGTTSAPKPIELTYGNFLWSAQGSAVALGLDPRERWLCALPLAHVGGLSILLRSAIYGTTAVIHPRFETAPVLAALRIGARGPESRRTHSRDRHAGRVTDSPAGGPVTLISLVATTLARLLDAGLERPPALRCALTGGGPVPAALLERARAAEVPVSLTYGLTEACSQVTTSPPPAPAGRDLERAAPALTGGGLAAAGGGLIAAEGGLAGAGGGLAGASGGRLAAASGAPAAGPPLFCTRLCLADDGEIMVAGPTVAPGAVGPDGWLRTGDLGRLNGEGSLEVTGRKADTIVSGGENVAPAEVEAVLEEHPRVLEAAVLARADDRWGEAVSALVVARRGASVSEQELRAHCAARLAPYKVPKLIALVTGPLPRTGSGKLLRRELS